MSPSPERLVPVETERAMHKARIENLAVWRFQAEQRASDARLHGNDEQAARLHELVDRYTAEIEQVQAALDALPDE